MLNYFESATGSCVPALPDALHVMTSTQRICDHSGSWGDSTLKHVSAPRGRHGDRDRAWEPPCRLTRRPTSPQRRDRSLTTSRRRRGPLRWLKRRWRSSRPSCRCGMEQQEEEDGSVSPSSLAPGPAPSRRASCPRAWPGPRSAPTAARRASRPLWGRNTSSIGFQTAILCRASRWSTVSR